MNNDGAKVSLSLPFDLEDPSRERNNSRRCPFYLGGVVTFGVIWQCENKCKRCEKSPSLDKSQGQFDKKNYLRWFRFISALTLEVTDWLKNTMETSTFGIR